MKYIIGLVAMLLPLLSGAQSPSIKPLNIGDAVPDITITNVYNYPSPAIRLSDLKGKLVILDFWATWCGNCIKDLPKVEELQNKFKGKLQIIMVGSDATDDKKKVSAFFKRREERERVSLSIPYALQNTWIQHYFPHRLLPHIVWIGTDGRVLKITDASYLKSENIAAMLNDNFFQSVVKEDLLDYNKAFPLSIGQNQKIEQSVLYRSALYQFLGAGNRTAIIKTNKNKSITYLYSDASIISLYAQASPELATNFKRSIILEVKDKNRFISDKQEQSQWSEANSFCYEITVPAGTSETSIKKWMLEDLNRYFGLRGRVEKHKTKVWKLSIYNRRLLESKSKISSDSLNANEYSLTLRNRPFKRLMFFLNTYFTNSPNVPIISDTDYEFNIDIDLKANNNRTLHDMQLLLRPLGINIIEEEKTLDMFVISDNK